MNAGIAWGVVLEVNCCEMDDPCVNDRVRVDGAWAQTTRTHGVEAFVNRESADGERHSATEWGRHIDNGS